MADQVDAAVAALQSAIDHTHGQQIATAIA